MSRPDLKSKVLNYRMNFLISYYNQEIKKQDLNNLMNDYINNFHDDYKIEPKVIPVKHEEKEETFS
jgi:hypothetical protein